MNCPNCNQAVTGEAAACPSCGQDLNPVVDATQPAPESHRNRPGWLVFGVAAAVVLGLGVAAFALLGGDDPAGARLADRFPADAIMYMEVDLEVLGSREFRSVVEAFQPLAELAGEEELDVDLIMEEMMGAVDESLAEVDLTYADDIEPWASGAVAFAMFGDPMEEQAAFVAEGEDPAAIDTMLAKLATHAVDTYTVDGSDFLGMDDFYLGRVGEDLVGATTTDLIEALVDGSAETLADVATFQRQVSAVPDGGLLVFAVDNEAALAGADMASMATEVLPGMPTPTGWTAFRLGVDDGNIRIDFAATLPEGFEFTGGDEAILDVVPADTIAFLRIGSFFQQYRSLAESEMVEGMEDMYGISLEQIFSMFARDGAIAVWPSSDPVLPVNAMLAALGDGDQSAAVDAIADFAASMGGTISETGWGYLIENLVGFGARGDLAVLSTQTELVEGPPADSFAGSDLYREATGLVEGDLQLALDVAGVIDLVDGLIAMSGDPETAEAVGCLPFGVAASGVEVDGADVSSTFVLEIEPHC